MKVIRVTKDEFELENGAVYPMMFDLDKVPSLKEFQQIYDESFDKFKHLFPEIELEEGENNE